VAAVAALCIPVLMLAVLALGFWHNALSFFGVIALALLGVVALWVALTRHGALRIASAVVVVLVFPAQIALLVGDDRGLLSVVLVAVLLAAFGVTARYALHDHRHRVHRADHPVGAARHPVLIVNLKSGGGKAEQNDLVREAEDRGIEVVVLRPGDDLRQLAEDAVDRGADVIGMAGGDGSQALVATVAMRRGVPHVCIPAGTRNHFALDLGLDRDDVVGALGAFGPARQRTIDLAQVNDRVFVNNASLGVYAKVVQSDEYRDAKLETWARMLPDLIGPNADPIDLAFDGPDGTRHHDAPLVLVSNNPYVLTRLAGAGTRVGIDGGVLGVVAALVRNSGDAAQLAALEVAGQASRFSGLLEWSVPTFDVDSGEPVEIGLDGEALVLDPPLRFRSLPEALDVRIPRDAPGLSPAAASVSLTSTNLTALARVALGRPPD
jgi:diacylglycerol kinase family enzyme